MIFCYVPKREKISTDIIVFLFSAHAFFARIEWPYRVFEKFASPGLAYNKTLLQIINNNMNLFGQYAMCT